MRPFIVATFVLVCMVFAAKRASAGYPADYVACKRALTDYQLIPDAVMIYDRKTGNLAKSAFDLNGTVPDGQTLSVQKDEKPMDIVVLAPVRQGKAEGVYVFTKNGAYFHEVKAQPRDNDTQVGIDVKIEVEGMKPIYYSQTRNHWLNDLSAWGIDSWESVMEGDEKRFVSITSNDRAHTREARAMLADSIRVGFTSLSAPKPGAAKAGILRSAKTVVNACRPVLNDPALGGKQRAPLVKAASAFRAETQRAVAAAQPTRSGNSGRVRR